MRDLTVDMRYVTAAGSPGPLERSIPSGAIFIIESAAVRAPAMNIRQFLFSNSRAILYLAPQSIRTTLYLPVSFHSTTPSTDTSLTRSIEQESQEKSYLSILKSVLGEKAEETIKEIPKKKKVVTVKKKKAEE